MELRQLRYFIAVAEEGHFGHAADRVRIAQPELSQQIKALERSVGAELIDREARPVRLTPAGERLLPLARTIVDAERATDVSGDDTPADVLRLGVPVIGHFPEFSELISRFKEHAPEVEMQVIPSTTPAMVDALVRRSLDVAVVHQPFDPPERGEPPRYLALGHRELVIALPEGHRLASLDRLPRAALLEEPILDWPDAIWPKHAAHARQLLFGTATHPRVIEVFDGLDESQFDFVRQGRGLTWLSVAAERALPIPLPGVVFRRVEDPRPLLEYGLAWTEPSASPATARLVRFVSEALEPSR